MRAFPCQEIFCPRSTFACRSRFKTGMAWVLWLASASGSLVSPDFPHPPLFPIPCSCWRRERSRTCRVVHSPPHANSEFVGSRHATSRHQRDCMMRASSSWAAAACHNSDGTAAPIHERSNRLTSRLAHEGLTILASSHETAVGDSLDEWSRCRSRRVRNSKQMMWTSTCIDGQQPANNSEGSRLIDRLLCTGNYHLNSNWQMCYFKPSDRTARLA